MMIQIERFDVVKKVWRVSTADEMRLFMDASGTTPLKNRELEFLVKKLGEGFQFFFIPNGDKYVPTENHFVFRGKEIKA